MKVEFAYKVLPNAKIAHDAEGNDTGAYVKISLDVKEECSISEYNDTHKKLIPFVAKKSMIEECYLQPISLEEYEAEHTDE
ncbi:hypothetical protein ACIQZG_08480 [Lysinibacillus sp. NPDC096418]|uniref:hypothetical protein n=1 Tax=Lysinibacillus sp. NPDC096418 TaxID=3364138 RepID=UPI00381B5CC0